MVALRITRPTTGQDCWTVTVYAAKRNGTPFSYDVGIALCDPIVSNKFPIDEVMTKLQEVLPGTKNKEWRKVREYITKKSYTPHDIIVRRKKGLLFGAIQKREKETACVV